MGRDLKRSITIRGHRTSISLEGEFWAQLQAIAAVEQTALSELISRIDSEREDRNLSSAARVYVLNHLLRN